MKKLTLFASLICFLAMLEMSACVVFKRDINIPLNPMTRKLTRKEIRKLKPKIDGIPLGKIKPHRLTGRVLKRNSAIIGGKPAVRNQFPWAVAIISNGASFCGGSVISPAWVLTAAHCIIGSPSIIMLMGTINWESPTGRHMYTSNISIKKVNFNRTTASNDIGLIKLLAPISNSLIASGKIVPIRLPKQSQASSTFVGVVMTVSGWGWSTDAGSVNSSLNFVSMPVISNAECAAVYGNLITRSKMCASPGSTKSKTGICSGDSGGGLHLKESDGRTTVFGIASFNAAATCYQYPAGYTRVSSFLKWISIKTGLFIRP